MRKLLTILLLMLFVVSCDRAKCKNTNLIFENNTPDSKVYKDELAKQLEVVDRTKLTYWLKDYKENEGKTSLYFYIQGDGLCAVLDLAVHDWNKLEGVRKSKGAGRFNAEFTNLKFVINSDAVTTEFVYKTFDNIID